jgi:hypothetical protein
MITVCNSVVSDEKVCLQHKIISSLVSQGFQVDHGLISLPKISHKLQITILHTAAVNNKRKQVSELLKKRENELLSMIASGGKIIPGEIRPRLQQVKRGTVDELLFRYACLHWSIPVSSGYGRRLRYLVFDDYNGKLIGLFGLGDPVFSMKARDDWVGWTIEDRKRRLRHVVDAFVLGAVPPYSYLLGGKLIAMLAASSEVQQAFREKYRDRQSLISGSSHDGQLAMLTTTSALGRSSIYNRLSYQDRLLYQSVGFTAGSGDFHFSNGIYEELVEFARQHCLPTAKNERWGKGFRNRREVIRKVLSELGLSWKLAFHQVRREIFVVPLAENTRAFLQGKESKLFLYHQSAESLFNWFRERWLLPRAERDERYRAFDPESWRLW